MQHVQDLFSPAAYDLATSYHIKKCYIETLTDAVARERCEPKDVLPVALYILDASAQKDAWTLSKKSLELCNTLIKKDATVSGDVLKKIERLTPSLTQIRDDGKDAFDHKTIGDLLTTILKTATQETASRNHTQKALSIAANIAIHTYSSDDCATAIRAIADIGTHNGQTTTTCLQRVAKASLGSPRTTANIALIKALRALISAHSDRTAAANKIIHIIDHKRPENLFYIYPDAGYLKEKANFYNDVIAAGNNTTVSKRGLVFAIQNLVSTNGAKKDKELTSALNDIVYTFTKQYAPLLTADQYKKIRTTEARHSINLEAVWKHHPDFISDADVDVALVSGNIPFSCTVARACIPDHPRADELVQTICAFTTGAGYCEDPSAPIAFQTLRAIGTQHSTFIPQIRDAMVLVLQFGTQRNKPHAIETLATLSQTHPNLYAMDQEPNAPLLRSIYALKKDGNKTTQAPSP